MALITGVILAPTFFSHRFYQLEAPELFAQRAEAQAKLQSAESQLEAAQAKLPSDQATYGNL